VPASVNLEFYDRLWSETRLADPERFNTWPLVRSLVDSTGERLEVGPGLRPRLPIAGTHFVDISRRALAQLKPKGARTAVADVASLPFADRRFGVVGAFDVIEHVADDTPVFRELARVLGDGGILVFSVPLHERLWTDFDALVGHVRRYEPAALGRSVAAHGLRVERSAVFGMAPRSRWLLELAGRMLERRRETAMRWYNRVILPLGLLLQRPLELEPGLVSSPKVDEVLIVCRRVVRP
jgi:SAM-dependent methyltransferase